mmetsp:Transcript_75652/g.202245  ORF Transcript_75652/g.202245 Transcript_75652/m.202245 type:complete len:265 (+) Transcript_75652:7108-7902(+)
MVDGPVVVAVLAADAAPRLFSNRTAGSGRHRKTRCPQTGCGDRDGKLIFRDDGDSVLCVDGRPRATGEAGNPHAVPSGESVVGSCNHCRRRHSRDHGDGCTHSGLLVGHPALHDHGLAGESTQATNNRVRAAAALRRPRAGVRHVHRQVEIRGGGGVGARVQSHLLAVRVGGQVPPHAGPLVGCCRLLEELGAVVWLVVGHLVSKLSVGKFLAEIIAVDLRGSILHSHPALLVRLLLHESNVGLAVVGGRQAGTHRIDGFHSQC